MNKLGNQDFDPRALVFVDFADVNKFVKTFDYKTAVRNCENMYFSMVGF